MVPCVVEYEVCWDESSLLSRNVHTCACFWFSKQDRRENESGFAVPFYSLLWSRHLVVIRSTIWKAREVILVRSWNFRRKVSKYLLITHRNPLQCCLSLLLDDFSELCVFTQSLHHEQDSAPGQFQSRVKLVWIQTFPSRRVALPRLKNPFCPIFFTPSWEKNSWIRAFL